MTSGMDWDILEGLEFAGRVTPELYNEGCELGKRFVKSLEN
jgi:hypothetical protein